MGTSARAFLALALLLWATSGRASSLFDPIYRFRVLATKHFIIYYHQNEDRLAARLASIAEETWAALERPLTPEEKRSAQEALVVLATHSASEPTLPEEVRRLGGFCAESA